ncbi:MAG: PilZ domain-containing protein [Pseudomonadales bacterium]|nr:PilZ domain-containing protein [Pseudomonadales bacterium]
MVLNANVVNMRKHERHNTDQSIIVIDTMTEQQVGLLANVSEDGLMIAGSTALETEAIYQLRLLLPEEIGASSPSINLGVDCLWVSGNEEWGGLYWSGCHIIDYADDAIEVLQLLVAHFTP